MVGGWGRCVGGMRTRSARESSSWPMRLDLPRQRATLPSKKSKNRPKGMKPKASQRLVRSVGSGFRQYRIEERMDMKPQNPSEYVSMVVCSGGGSG